MRGPGDEEVEEEKEPHPHTEECHGVAHGVPHGPRVAQHLPHMQQRQPIAQPTPKPAREGSREKPEAEVSGKSAQTEDDLETQFWIAAAPSSARKHNNTFQSPTNLPPQNIQ